MAVDHESDQLQSRLKKLEEFKENNVEVYGEKYQSTHYSLEIKDHFEELEGHGVSVAGRILTRRGHGKASFAHLQDSRGQIQVYVRQDQVGADNYELYHKLDLGDIIGVSGEVFKTRTGEVTINVSSFRLLSKSLRPLPEKWHGLKDVDIRYRQRYLDLIVNPEARDVFITRSKIIQAFRAFLTQREFLEVETPVMHSVTGGASARPFETYHNALGIKLYLRIATELHLKRLLVGGFDKIFELGKVFRNEGISPNHNPEFTSVEIYQANSDYEDMMTLTEEIISSTAQQVLGTTKISYQGKELDLSTPWPRKELLEVIYEFTGIDFSSVPDDESAREIARQYDLEIDEGMKKGDIIFSFFEKFCEDKLWGPIFVKDYPIEVSPLAKCSQAKPEFTNRFEAFLAGKEVANAFTELNDPLEQRRRFEQQVKQREAGDEEAHMMDEDFLAALEHGMPPAGGLGIGIDRLVMILTDASSIRDVILFPTLRPK